MPDETTYISWNVPNWITILIMVGLGFAVVGAITKMIQMKRGTASA